MYKLFIYFCIVTTHVVLSPVGLPMPKPLSNVAEAEADDDSVPQMDLESDEAEPEPEPETVPVIRMFILSGLKAPVRMN